MQRKGSAAGISSAGLDLALCSFWLESPVSGVMREEAVGGEEVASGSGA